MQSGLPYVSRGVIWSYFSIHVQVCPSSGCQYHNCIHPLMGMHWTDQSWHFSSAFSLILFWDGFIMRFPGINILRRSVELDSLSALVVAAGEVFPVFKRPLHGVLFGLVLKHFALFRRVPSKMQEAYIFCTGRSISQIACMVSLALTSAALLGVGWRGGSYSLLFPVNNGLVGFFLLIIIRRCYPFVDRLCNFHAIKKCRMYSCRTLIKNPIPVDRLVLLTIWERCEG